LFNITYGVEETPTPDSRSAAYDDITIRCGVEKMLQKSTYGALTYATPVV
jgi:hypothetical protein